MVTVYSLIQKTSLFKELEQFRCAVGLLHLGAVLVLFLGVGDLGGDHDTEDVLSGLVLQLPLHNSLHLQERNIPFNIL